MVVIGGNMGPPTRNLLGYYAYVGSPVRTVQGPARAPAGGDAPEPCSRAPAVHSGFPSCGFRTRSSGATDASANKGFSADVARPSGEVVTAHCAIRGAMTGTQHSGRAGVAVALGQSQAQAPHSWELIEVFVGCCFFFFSFSVFFFVFFCSSAPRRGGLWASIQPSNALARRPSRRASYRSATATLRCAARGGRKYGAIRVDVMLRMRAAPVYVEIKNVISCARPARDLPLGDQNAAPTSRRRSPNGGVGPPPPS